MNITGQKKARQHTTTANMVHTKVQSGPFLTQNALTRKAALNKNSAVLHATTRGPMTHIVVAVAGATGDSTEYMPSVKAATKDVIEACMKYMDASMYLVRLSR